MSIASWPNPGEDEGMGGVVTPSHRTGGVVLPATCAMSAQNIPRAIAIDPAARVYWPGEYMGSGGILSTGHWCGPVGLKAHDRQWSARAGENFLGPFQLLHGTHDIRRFPRN
jgi:hypothetical protein